MIKVMMCLRRLSGFSQKEFHIYWLETHGPLVRRVAPALKIRRYVQNHMITDLRISAAIAARGELIDPFDGVAELWWDNIEQIISVSNTREGRSAGRQLLEDERRFIDLSSSALFYCREHEIFRAG